MTRKDYELLAAALRTTRITARPDLHPQAVSMWWQACSDIADALASQNPRFNRERFLKACGAES